MYILCVPLYPDEPVPSRNSCTRIIRTRLVDTVFFSYKFMLIASLVTGYEYYRYQQITTTSIVSCKNNVPTSMKGSDFYAFEVI